MDPRVESDSAPVIGCKVAGFRVRTMMWKDIDITAAVTKNAGQRMTKIFSRSLAFLKTSHGAG